MTAIARRDPAQVMRLARMGAMHASRLSFMPTLLRHLTAESWRVERPVWRVDDKGVGVGVFAAHGPGRSYSLVALAHDLPDARRSDRVIATAWDATFALFDGIPGDNDIRRLQAEVPKQEAGRMSERELVLSRANRSVRLFNHSVERLASGRQPDAREVRNVGYLMRTTAVYASGKFGLADREVLAGRGFMNGPFRLEMLTVYLIRLFTFEIVEHLADARARASGRKAARLLPETKRALGVGNATGLGMAPFLLTHPTLLGNWMAAREEALARVRALRAADERSRLLFRERLARMRSLAESWRTSHEIYAERIARLRNDLARLAERERRLDFGAARPWDSLYRWGEAQLSLEGCEALVSLLFEPHPGLVDGLAECMSADENSGFVIDGARPAGALIEAIARSYDWALSLDFADGRETARIWYVSSEKLEPRLGARDEPGLDKYEQPLAPGRDMAALFACLKKYRPQTPTAEVLLRHPQHRDAVRRLQFLSDHPYAEIRDNTIGARLLPLDLLRCKLAFFGATRFDPRSDRWLRICMYQGAPLPDGRGSLAGAADDWILPDP